MMSGRGGAGGFAVRFPEPIWCPSPRAGDAALYVGRHASALGYDNAEAIMALEAVHLSNLWGKLWKLEVGNRI